MAGKMQPPKLTLAHSKDPDFSFLDGFKNTWNKASTVPYYFKNIPEELSGSLQENVLTLVCTSDKFCRSVQLNVPLELFSNHAMRRIAREAYSYIEATGKAPREHLPDLMETVLAGNDDIAPAVLHIIGSVLDAPTRGFNEAFVAQKLYHFVELQQLKITVAALYKAAETEDLQEARKAIYESPLRIGNALGLSSTIATVEQRIPHYFIGEERESLFLLNIPELDRYQLGPQRKELHLFMAPPKRGKSWWLIHCAKQALLARLRVLYITLEMSSERVLDRAVQSMFALTARSDMEVTLPKFILKKGLVTIAEREEGLKKGMVTAVERESVKKQGSLYNETGKRKIKKAFDLNHTGQRAIGARLLSNLFVAEFPTGALQLQELEGYLEYLEVEQNFVPDLCLLDYADLMYLPTQNYRLNLSQLCQGLRGLAVRRNMALASATQSNRGSMDDRKIRVIAEKEVAEDVSKIAIADTTLSYNQSAVEKDAGVARIFVVTSRNAPDKFSVNITQSYQTGQFCLESTVIDHRTYESILPKHSGREDTMDEE